ncbi:MAG: VTT domain-containing protein [Chloroflexales bacterium]|nr:VTT domain-containing protein [Chloroflexales bacterium]
MTKPASSSATPAQAAWQRWARPIVIGGLVLLLNVLIYIWLPPNLVERLGALSYAGAFIVAAIANASVIVPVPYFPVLIRLGQVFDPWGVVLMAAAGSALGESVAFFVGRAGRSTVAETRFYRWVQTQLQHPWRAALVLFALSAPPNPAFDVAGLLAGALGLPLWLFLVSVFLGRIIRMALVVFLGLGITELW